ncbi:hypothetical protein HHK36_011349 [Tetracentron sinense]|uniref:Uncharacterized protein n=1 Tax=Tetracentron sinense TaxID=13715 RepID=A0A835DG42_TETSI|nr:hypothetical protein HHK36_011349 [Tetracentron sinense]
MKISGKLLLFVFDLFLVYTLSHGNSDVERKSYIIYMGDAPEAGTASIDAVDHHHNLLSSAIGEKSVFWALLLMFCFILISEKIARESRIHSYGKSFSGFAARLLPHEAERLKETDSVVSVFPNTRRKLHTTRSWDFIGMPQRLKRNTQIESNTIVGVFDTGIASDAPSFNDKGYGPPPPKWKGICVTGGNFSGCNKYSIISLSLSLSAWIFISGARYYHLGNFDQKLQDPSPEDTEGHGTHTSSTVAGISVDGASLYGLGEGTARGGVPSARLAMYKVCWQDGCSDIDILAAFDDAISDGVDLISISIGGPTNYYFADSMGIGAFQAMKKGILTVCSAGNDGPNPWSVQNIAPWIMTIAASGMDRQFRTVVGLGNGMKTSGISVNTYSPTKRMYPLIDGASAANLTGEGEFLMASTCDPGTLNKTKVKGKIVYCQGSTDLGLSVDESGGVGTIVSLTRDTDTGFTFLIPAANVGPQEADIVTRYINSTKNPNAVIYKSKAVNVTAPFPDIAAPGVDILAGFPRKVSVTGSSNDKRFGDYNIISGTSMACPHAAAAAAYVKTFHPDWSPAAIKSALMTTATEMKIKGMDAEFGYGSGQINPIMAVHPGLVYDMQTSSYISFLCKEGINGTALARINVGSLVNCSSFPAAQGVDGLNYPSMSVHIANLNDSISAVFYRTVTNVGYAKSVYKATVTSPKGLSVTVIPDTLRFNRLHQKKSFKVVLNGRPLNNGTQSLSASLEWSDLRRSVRSPILVYTPPPLSLF